MWLESAADFQTEETTPMRLWHLTVVILVVGIVLSVVRDPVGRVALIVFVTGLGEAALGLAAVMALFQTIGAIGMARGLLDHAEAVAATTLVLLAATVAALVWATRDAGRARRPNGWGIPMAPDIAFALTAPAALGSRAARPDRRTRPHRRRLGPVGSAHRLRRRP